MTKKNIFSEETIRSLVEYGEVLRSIHNRLVLEGKVKVVDGKIIFLSDKQKDDTTSKVQRQFGRQSKGAHRRRDIKATRANG